MGRRGPPKKPTALKVLQGIPGGKSKLVKNEPQPKKVKQAAPPYQLNERELKIWQEITPQLEAVGLLTGIDLQALARYVTALDQYLTAKAFVDAAGSFYYEIYFARTKSEIAEGKPARVKYRQVYPEVGIMRALSKELRSLEREFGMTPAARAGISVDGDPPRASDTTDALLYGET
jgi:P27 family predicted phage terminase small subunit